jgi:hypothetical protein
MSLPRWQSTRNCSPRPFIATTSAMRWLLTAVASRCFCPRSFGPPTRCASSPSNGTASFTNFSTDGGFDVTSRSLRSPGVRRPDCGRHHYGNRPFNVWKMKQFRITLVDHRDRMMTDVIDGFNLRQVTMDFWAMWFQKWQPKSLHIEEM